MTTINPAECDRTTVYAGECRDFSDTEWRPFQTGRRRSPGARDGNPWLVDVEYGPMWLRDDQVRNLVPLVPAPAGGQWTRELEGELWAAIRDELRREYPSATDHDHRKLDLAASASVDAVREKLNAHCSKPEPYDQGGVRGADSLLYRAERERDAAVARAEQAEARVRLANQQSVEWEGEAERLLCERDEWKARAEAAEARTAPAVTREDVKGVIDHWIVQGGNHEALLDDLWRWVSGSDPAVHVVRESDLPAARVDGDYYVVASAKGDYKWPQHGPSWWAGRAQDALAKAARYTALARLAAREAVVDPVEAKAREEADRRYSGDPNHAFIEGAVWAARHVLGGENAV